MKKLISIALSSLLVMTILASCNQEAKNDPAQVSQTPTATVSPDSQEKDKNTTNGEEEKNYFHKYDPGIVLTVNVVDTGDMKMLDDQTKIKNEYTEWIKEKTGITIEAAWVVADAETNNQKINLAAMSNSLPDIIMSSSEVIGKLIPSKLVRPIDDLLENYTSPLTKEIIRLNMESTQGRMFYPFTYEKQIYGFPKAIDSGSHWETNWIRADILKELGKEKPKTLEDMEDVLAAYQQAYPDGIGFIMLKDFGGGNDLRFVGSAFEAYPQSWIKAADGSLTYGSIQPEMRPVLETYAKWYKNGWLDPEFVIKDWSNRTEIVTSGNFLSFKGQWWNVYSPFTDMFKNLPDSDITDFPVLTGPDGKIGLTVNMVYNNGTAISSKCANPEALVYLYNEEMDSYYRNTDSSVRKKLHEDMAAIGYEFKYKPEPQRDPLNPGEDIMIYDYPAEGIGYGFFNRYSTHDDLTFGFQGTLIGDKNSRFIDSAMSYLSGAKGSDLVGAVKKQYEDFMINDRIKYVAPVFQYWDEMERSDILHADEFNGTPTQTMVEKKTYLDKLELETFVNIIIGQSPIDEFDKFVAEWKANGGDEIIKEVNEWYKNIH